MELSTYQKAILDFIQHGKGNAVVDAKAGSGKTSSLIEVAKVLPKEKKALFVAFNKHIKDELANRLSAQGIDHVYCSTIHALGLRSLGKCDVQAHKYNDLCHSWLDVNLSQFVDDEPEYAQPMEELLRFVQLTLSEHNKAAYTALCKRYDIDLDFDGPDGERITKGMADILKQGHFLYETQKMIDYNEMLVLPVKEHLVMPKYDFILVDEAQDLSPAQLELLLMCRSSSTRIIFMGDKNQSIYAFCGADSDSIPHIIERCEATVLPLSISYRCPKSHIELANTIRPGTEPSPTAIDGTVDEMLMEDVIEKVQKQDMILCRTTAPLVSTCFELIREGIPATVRGRDIGQSLLALLKKMQKTKKYRCRDLEQLEEKIHAYVEHQCFLLDKKPHTEMQQEQVRDKMNTCISLKDGYIVNCQQSGKEPKWDDFENFISSFFTEMSKGAVICTTVHKAKGLEADVVYILKRELLPHPMAKQDWEKEQELNIQYVAYTRAKKELHFVVDKLSDAEEEDTAKQPVIS